jgi:glycerol-3-phosphate O-acyltransferase
VGKKKGVFEPRVTPNIDYKNILLLSYYRNNLIHLFIQEAFVSCSLFGFSAEEVWSTGVNRQVLWNKVLFISNLMRNEFVVNTNFKAMGTFDHLILYMVKNNSLIELENGDLCIKAEQENYINFLNSLIWPFIDSYWITFMFIYSLFPSKFVQQSQAIVKIQALADRLHKDQILPFFESCSQEVIKNAISIFENDEVIVKKKLQTTIEGGIDPFVLTLSDKFNEEHEVNQIFEAISFFRKPTPVNTLSLTQIRKELNDVPGTAKI